MYTVRIALVLLQLLAIVEAKVKWTLHSSCYRTRDGQNDDTDLENAMIDAVSTSKAWAKRGSEKLQGMNKPFRETTKESMQPLLGKGDFDSNVKDVIDKFDKLNELVGPIGKERDASGRYETSAAWKNLPKLNRRLNFLLVCRPSFQNRLVEGGPPDKTFPYDLIRQHPYYTEHVDLKTMIEEENAGTNWNNLQGNNIKAITSVDGDDASRKKELPETITFHPLWIQHQRAQNFAGWTDELFQEVTAKNAVQVFKEKGEGKDVDIVPIDGLLEASFVRNVFHEFFHLSAFGGMKDSREGAYLWVNNVKNQDRMNPDLFAIIAVVIELLNRDGDKYKVHEHGVVTKRR